jgi:hypothetical protein
MTSLYSFFLKKILNVKFASTLFIFLIIFIPLSWAIDFQTPSKDFLNSALTVKTNTKNKILKIKLVEFIVGISTDKQWEKVNDNLWILKSKYKDPVINDYRRYTFVFQKMDGTVMLSKATFDGRYLLPSELEKLANHIVKNYESNISVK